MISNNKIAPTDAQRSECLFHPESKELQSAALTNVSALGFAYSNLIH